MGNATVKEQSESMKIDFYAKFRELEKVVRTPVNHSGSTNEQGVFKTVLGKLVPAQADKVEKAEKIQESVPHQAAIGPPMTGGEEMKASLGLKSPDPLKPLISPMGAVLAEDEPVKSEHTGVKTPSIVSVRRVSDPFAGMHRSARMQAVDELVREAGKKHGVDPVLSMAVVSSESDFNATAVSRDGFASKGLFQLLDSTGHGLHAREGHTTPYNPFNPALNVDLGVSYLRKLHDIFSYGATLPNNYRAVPAANSSSLEKLAVAAFNAGEGRVAWAQSRAQRAGFNPAYYEQIKAYLPESTKEYVERVMDRKAGFEKG